MIKYTALIEFEDRAPGEKVAVLMEQVKAFMGSKP